MTLYAAIDLHSNNNYLCVIDGKDKRLLEAKFDNDANLVIQALKPYKRRLMAVAIESTFNWYWLADALMEAGFEVRLVNTAKVIQYEGLKRTDDRYDAFFLSHLMRLGILPTGYIYPLEQRGLRDLLRRRMRLVQDRTRYLNSLNTQYQRQTGQHLSCNKINSKLFRLPIVGDANVMLAMKANLNMCKALKVQIKLLEKSIMSQVKDCKEFNLLKTTNGISDILAETILLETGDISRFNSPGNYASYCRCVDSCKSSNGKKKGVGNRKNGNKYLAWAFIEAANFAIRYNLKAKNFYERKKLKTNNLIALKALAHKLSRACYYIMKQGVPFDENKIFS
jgi:transposase